MFQLRCVALALLLVAAGGTLLAPAARAQCGGLCIYEQGTPDTARAAAGAGALASGAATVWWNPAGMTNLEGTHISIGTDILLPSAEFEIGPGSTPGSDGGDFPPDVLIVPGAYIVANPWKELRIGFSLNGPWGGNFDYDLGWVGRTLVTDVELLALNMQPAFAYPITDWLSVGGGINITWVDFKFEMRASAAPTATVIQIRDANDWAVSGNVALMLTPREGTRIGILYRSPVDLRLSGGVDTTVPLSVSFDTKLDFAQGVNVSLFHQLTPTLAILVDGGWSDWSEFTWQPVSVGPFGSGIPRNFRDTWRLGGGVRYQASEKLLVQSGVSYDSSPVTARNRLPDMPADEAVRFGLGMEFTATENITLHAGYEFAWLGNARFDNVSLPGGTVIDGKFNSNMLNTLSMGVALNF